MDSIWLTLLFPILGAITLSTFGDRLSKAMVGLVATGSVVASFVVVLLRVRAMLSLEVPRVVEAPLWTWLEIPLPNGQSVPIGFTALVDTLSITLLLVITGVGGLIHWYSTEYMAEEKHYSRYFTYLNLFVAAMTLLVLANNLAVLLIGWAGVGFASWALIGFFTHKPSAVAAARKAFVVNVIGDVGLMVSIFVAAWHLGSTDYSAILLPANYAKGSDFMGSAHIFAAGLLVAAYAKSAQLPMHTWLPDAMEGPTPVSALIHAATMVTAGVYLVVRCGGVFTHLPDMAILVAGLGAFTALFAAICALFQNDLKRVLAYSTMSQLGYMFMAAGVGAYQAAIFHLVIHAFFKALLFLAAGNVIHATHGEQDMRKLGGLLKDLPLTSGTFAIGALALTGLPPAAGFWSKEMILGSVHHSTAPYAGLWFVVAAVTALLTAFYTGRAFFLTFLGPAPEDRHLHLPGAQTSLTCFFLAILSLGGGWFYNRVLTESADPPPHHPMDSVAIGLLVLIFVTLVAAYFRYKEPTESDFLGGDLGLAPYFRNGFGLDKLFLGLATSLITLGRDLYATFDSLFRSWFPDLLARMALGLGRSASETQTGQLRHYALMIGTALTLFMVYVVLVFGGLAK